MPYDSNAELPDNVRNNLPSHAQEIYRKAFNSAWKEYRKPQGRRGDSDREETAHKVPGLPSKRSITRMARSGCGINPDTGGTYSCVRVIRGGGRSASYLPPGFLHLRIKPVSAMNRRSSLPLAD
ncbi:ChaB family protein [Aidingimonas lacisalsi]|uniref:ChaB family protein n=1 Tax=Aidingimonas lacisalsi TaxID=2604086 RepID=UPI001F3DAD99|nr:ChaB family protein [Aidingimonas lacisalsi]